MSIFDALQKTLGQFLSALPNMVGAIVLIVIGWILARIVRGIIKKVLVAIKIDVLGDKLNEIDIVEQANIKVRPSVIISSFIYYILILIFLVAASDTLGMEVVSAQISDLISYIPRLLSALIVLTIGLIFANVVKNIVTQACEAVRIGSAKAIGSIVFYFLLINILLSALTQAEVNTEFLTDNLKIILAGIIFALAIGYGFASKDIMANLMSSLYTRNKFNIGDVIKVGDVKGTIVHKDNTAITLRPQEGNSKIIIPLSKLNREDIEIF